MVDEVTVRLARLALSGDSDAYHELKNLLDRRGNPQHFKVLFQAFRLWNSMVSLVRRLPTGKHAGHYEAYTARRQSAEMYAALLPESLERAYGLRGDIKLTSDHPECQTLLLEYARDPSIFVWIDARVFEHTAHRLEMEFMIFAHKIKEVRTTS